MTSVGFHALKIIYRKIETRVAEERGEEQFGCRQSKGTVEAILPLRLVIERSFRKQSTYVTFVDLELPNINNV